MPQLRHGRMLLHHTNPMAAAPALAGCGSGSGWSGLQEKTPAHAFPSHILSLVRWDSNPARRCRLDLGEQPHVAVLGSEQREVILAPAAFQIPRPDAHPAILPDCSTLRVSERRAIGGKRRRSALTGPTSQGGPSRSVAARAAPLGSTPVARSHLGHRQGASSEESDSFQWRHAYAWIVKPICRCAAPVLG